MSTIHIAVDTEENTNLPIVGSWAADAMKDDDDDDVDENISESQVQSPPRRRRIPKNKDHSPHRQKKRRRSRSRSRSRSDDKHKRGRDQQSHQSNSHKRNRQRNNQPFRPRNPPMHRRIDLLEQTLHRIYDQCHRNHIVICGIQRSLHNVSNQPTQQSQTLQHQPNTHGAWDPTQSASGWK
jgi:hypothetical protein